VTDFDPRIDRELAARMGLEAVEIAEAGEYAAPSGARVDIRDAVARARASTREHPPDADLPATTPGPHPTLVEVTRESTLAALRRLLDAGRRAAALNFASALAPGGGFLGGAVAPEESLCRSSALFACLRDRRMYAYHREHGDDLYTDWAIHSPDVPVFRGDDHRLLERPYLGSFVTCAAPNATALRRFDPRRLPEIEPAFRSRIARVLAIGAVHGHDALVLGAWGCGAFGCDPDRVARLFREALGGPFRGTFAHVVFAIAETKPDGRCSGPFERELGRGVDR
jgi:uncharacterized protein (TIGR02452 family)